MRFTEEYRKDIERVLRQVPQSNQLANHSLLLTGVTGMIVSTIADVLLWYNRERDAHLTLYFAGRNKERVVNRFPLYQEGIDYSFVYFDATSSDELNLKVDYIINGASHADPKSFVSQPVETMLASLYGVNILLRMAKKQGAKRFLQISSSEVYGKKETSEPYGETEYGFVDILNPRACYPCAKRAADTLCVSYAAEYGVDVVMIRPGHIYGPSITLSDSRVSSEFTRLAASGKNLTMKSAGLQMRSYCHTLDCASAILTVLLNGESSTVYNISNKESVVTIREMAEAFAEAGHVKLVIEDATEAEKKGYNLMNNSSLDGTRLERLGWKALFGMREGAKRTLEEYRNGTI